MIRSSDVNHTEHPAESENAVIAVPAVKKKGLRKWILPIDALLVLAAVLAYILIANQYRDRFIPGTSINGYDASGHYVDEINAQLGSIFDGYALAITFSGEEKPVVLEGKDIYYRFVTDGSVGKLLGAQNRFAWLPGLLGFSHTYEVPVKAIYDEPAFSHFILGLDELDPLKMEEPHDAYLTFDEDLRLMIVPEVTGNLLDPIAAEDAIRKALDQNLSELDLTETEGIYTFPTIMADSPSLVESMEDVNAFLDTKVTFTMSDGSDYIIDDSLTRKLLHINADGTYTIGDKELPRFCAKVISDIASQDNNYGKFFPFKTTKHGMIPLPANELHGHLIDRSVMCDLLTDALKTRTSLSHEMVYATYLDHSDSQIGGTYIEIDIYAQRVYYYKDYELALETPCVTGTEGVRETPSGIYSILHKYYDTILEGPPLEDGTPSYSSHVWFFLSFLGGYGLHDAYWRSNSEFSNTSTYRYDGSHGCVNLPYDAADFLYHNVEVGTPVIIYREKDEEKAA